MTSAAADPATISRRSLMHAGAATASVLALAALARTDQPVLADPPPASTTRESVTLAAAQALIAAGMAKAQEINVPMTIVVVDESGVLKASVRMDGNVLASVEWAQSKAFTAAATRTPTHVLAGRLKDDATRIASLIALPHMTLSPGGFPIAHGNAVIGGVGAGGGTPEQDQAVAEATLAALM